MPELPEVEHTRRLLERRLVGHRLIDVHAADDGKVFPENGGRALEEALRTRTVVSTDRHGKWAWLNFDAGPAMLFHLGMTGAFRYPGDVPLELESSPATIDRSWPPRFTKLRFVLGDGSEVAMTDPRRFGRVLLRASPREEPPVRDLGFDPLVGMPRLPEFRALLGRRRGVLKALLLDQTFAAGVGNWIADEVLYQAGLDPRRLVATLSDDETRALHTALAKVVTIAVGADAQKDALPRTWLFHHRWGKRADARTARGERIEHLTVAGRTTAWVPSRQR